MYKYVLERLLMLIPVIIGVTFIVFFILNLSPGDPAAIILGDQASAEALAMKREELGLNDPLLVRYGHYMINMLHGDLGTSYKNNLSVWSQVMERFPNTAVLAVAYPRPPSMATATSAAMTRLASPPLRTACHSSHARFILSPYAAPCGARLSSYGFDDLAVVRHRSNPET